MADKFYDGMENVNEELNAMDRAFAAGPYDAVPRTGGAMTGPMVNTAGVYVGDVSRYLTTSSSMRSVHADSTPGGFKLAATYGVRGIPGSVFDGQWEAVTSCGASGGSGRWNNHSLTFTASDVDTGAGNIYALQLLGNGSAKVGVDLTVPGVTYLGIQDTEQQGVVKLRVANAGYFAICSGSYGNANSTALSLTVNTGNGRSLNAAGTLNASGADYAEYMVKATTCGVVAPGQVVGIDENGHLTDRWAEAISFIVKSTNPCMVGGDSWAVHLGERPEDPAKWPQFDVELEQARQRVDRIAFAGQVPVNLLGATPGQFIVPVRDGDGIAGLAVNKSAMTFDQYMSAIGRVIAIEDDGRARIIVKVA